MTNTVLTDSGVKHQNHIPQDNNNNIKSKPKSTVNLSKQPSGSSFMKPTASHLAKQNKECDMHLGGFGRFLILIINYFFYLHVTLELEVN